MEPAAFLLVIVVVGTVVALNYMRGTRGARLLLMGGAALVLSLGYVLLRGV